MIKVKLEKILNKAIELDWASDSNLIGGLVFESGDNIIECSLQHKLQEIKKEITIAVVLSISFCCAVKT